MQEISNDIVKVSLKKKTTLDDLSFAIPFSIYFDHLFHGYFFETRLTAIHQSELHFKMPRSVYYTDRRRDKRIEVEGGALEFPLPFPTNAKYKVPLIDLSESGASFKAPMHGYYFLPDTPLKPVKITTKGVVRDGLRGEVRFLVPLDDDHFKVGIEFASWQRKGFDVTKVAVSRRNYLWKAFGGLVNKLRVGFYLSVSKNKARNGLIAEKSELQPQVVRFKNFSGHEMVGLVNSTTPLGVKKILAPVVIIPPAYTKRKETTSALALTLIDNFKKRGKDLIVIRVDLTNATGESYIDPENHIDGKNYINFTPETAINDIMATIRYCQNNQFFSASKIAIVTFSFTAPMARKAIICDKGRSVKYWINAMGTPHLQELIKNASGGIDYIGNYARGARFGIVNFLGELGNIDNFCEKCIASGTAFLEDARRDMELINIPVTWMYAKYDSWVNPKAIKDVMSVRSNYLREVVEVSTGHLPVSTDEAFGNFRLISDRMWHHLMGGDITSEDPDLVKVVRIREMEWNRIPKIGIGDSTSYWRSYLLGQNEKDVGYDIMSLTDEYRQLMHDQIDELDLKPGNVVGDISGGTGNFLKFLWEKNKGVVEGTFVTTDFIAEALERAKEKHSFAGNSSINCRYSPLNLELSRLLPLMHFINGELPDVTALKGKIEGLSDFTLQTWQDRYSYRLHRILRGGKVDDDLDYLEGCFEESDVEKIIEFNQASQLARALQLGQHDQFNELLNAFSFDYLVIKTDKISDLSYPLETGSFDRILLSLVVSYVFNPSDIVGEMHRCLKRGGKIVLSSFRADADMTTSYTNLIRKVEEMPVSPFPNLTKEELLMAARHYANNAAKLLSLGDEGTFHFFTENQMKDLLTEVGFKQISLSKSFGNPGQVAIVSGIKV